MTCVDIDADFGPILYGNPFRQRKIGKQDLSNLVTVSRGDLKDAFLESLRSACAIAASRCEPLLLTFMGHGKNTCLAFAQ
jgi:hypothetical protein